MNQHKRDWATSLFDGLANRQPNPSTNIDLVLQALQATHRVAPSHREPPPPSTLTRFDRRTASSTSIVGNGRTDLRFIRHGVGADAWQEADEPTIREKRPSVLSLVPETSDDEETAVYAWPRSRRPAARRVPSAPANVNVGAPANVNVDAASDTVSDLDRPSDGPTWVGLRPGSRRLSGTATLGIVVAALSLAGAAVYRAAPRPATATVVVTGSGNAPIHDAVLVVDGLPRCTASPCILHLESGMHQLRARAEGYSDHEQGISITPGSELVLEIALGKTSSASVDASGLRDGAELAADTKEVGFSMRPTAVAEPGPGAVVAPDKADEPASVDKSTKKAKPVRRTYRAPAVKKKVAAETPQEPSDGTCSFNVNSIPASNVLVDGRPYGSTPLIGISVGAGAHTVLFTLSDGGRETRTATCNAGESRTIAVRLKNQE